MKKVALTVAVLALGLAACQDQRADNNTSADNTVETEAAADVNAATDTTADNALDAAGNAVENAGKPSRTPATAVDERCRQRDQLSRPLRNGAKRAVRETGRPFFMSDRSGTGRTR